jgi:hypothetical protein
VFPESKLSALLNGVIDSRSSKVATRSIYADLLGVLKEILFYGIGGLSKHSRVYNAFLLEPFSVDSLNGTVLGGKPVD